MSKHWKLVLPGTTFLVVEQRCAYKCTWARKYKCGKRYLREVDPLKAGSVLFSWCLTPEKRQALRSLTLQDKIKLCY